MIHKPSANRKNKTHTADAEKHTQQVHNKKKVLKIHKNGTQTIHETHTNYTQQMQKTHAASSQKSIEAIQKRYTKHTQQMQKMHIKFIQQVLKTMQNDTQTIRETHKHTPNAGKHTQQVN